MNVNCARRKKPPPDERKLARRSQLVETIRRAYAPLSLPLPRRRRYCLSHSGVAPLSLSHSRAPHGIAGSSRTGEWVAINVKRVLLSGAPLKWSPPLRGAGDSKEKEARDATVRTTMCIGLRERKSDKCEDDESSEVGMRSAGENIINAYIESYIYTKRN